jgi:hypothetical protein
MIDYNSAKENRDRDGLYRYWFDKLKIQSYNTERSSIITDEEYEKYVQIFVDYDMAFQRFPANHPKFPNMPMARLIGDYFDYSAKVHGFETYSEFVRWKYNDGPWKPSGQIFYFDDRYGDKDE